MTTFMVHGLLSGAILDVGDHTHVESDRELAVVGDRITATRTNAPKDDDEQVADLHEWVDSYLQAMSVTVGMASHVYWDGVTRFRPDGSTRIAKSMTTMQRYIRQRPASLGSYQSLAAEIRSDPLLADASAHLRSAFELMQQSHEAGAGEAYRVVEELTGSHVLSDWEAFGSTLSVSGLGKSSRDMRILWASSQFYRHDRSQVGAARTILSNMKVPPLDYGACCFAAAEVLEGYVAAKKLGVI